MEYTNSPLVTEVLNFGTKNSNPRNQYYSDTKKCYNPTGAITKIPIHHMAGKMTAKACAQMHYKSSGSSANYYIGYDGEICQGVDESRRAWTTGDRDVDSNGVTIEVSNDINETPWTISDKSYESLIKLVADICKRNGIKQAVFTNDKSGNLVMHRWYQNTACPGDYLASKFSDIEKRVNAILNGGDNSPIEPTQQYFEYTVKKNDTLSGIAATYGVTQKAIMALNPSIKDPNKIYVGQVIKIPVVNKVEVTKPSFQSYTGTVNAKAGLNVRAKAGTSKDCRIIRCLPHGTKVTIVNETKVGLIKWGQLSTGGWVCLTYVKR